MSVARVSLIIGAILVIAGGVAFALDRARSTPHRPSATGSVTIPVDVATATLHSPTGDATATGVATHQFVEVVFVHGITATLPDLPPGQFYAGWLIKAADVAHPLPTGQLLKDASHWTLNFSSPTDYSSYDGVIVTVQTGEGQAPGTTVLTGSFQTP